MGCLAAQPILRRWRAGRLAAAAATLLLAVLSVRAAPALVRTPNHRGLIESLDRLAGHLRSDDVILAQPSASVAQFSPYLKARFDLDLYVQQYRADAWRETLPLLRGEAAAGRRVLYIADEPMATPDLPCLKLLACEPVRYRALAERLHAVPDSEIRVETPVFIYALEPAAIPDGWWPKWRWPVPKRPPAPLPVELAMDSRAEPHLTGFFDPTPLGDGRTYRWTDGRGKIAIGELVDLATTAPRVRIIVRMGTARTPEAGNLSVDWYLDMDKPSRARKLGATSVASGLEDHALELDAGLLRSDSVLDLWSLRPAVGTERVAGELGVAVESVRIEAFP
jgi:hypothetical protein